MKDDRNRQRSTLWQKMLLETSVLALSAEIGESSRGEVWGESGTRLAGGRKGLEVGCKQGVLVE